MISELLVPAFILVWFGLGAVMVGCFVSVFPTMAFIVQVQLWAVTSTLTVIAWYKIFKPQHQRALEEYVTSKKMIGSVGHLIKDIAPRKKGQVRFQEAHFGSEIWDCKATEKIAADTLVKVIDAKGRILKVSKIENPK